MAPGTGQDWGWGRGGPQPSTSGNPLATMAAKMEEGALWACPVSRDFKTEQGWLARGLRLRDTHAALQGGRMFRTL